MTSGWMLFEISINLYQSIICVYFLKKCVPVENTLMYAAGLRRVGVPFELHIFEKGEHGLSRVSDELIWSKRKFEREYPWLSLSVDWLNQLF